MNDFTKKELLDLRSTMVDWHEKDNVSQITDDPLLDKIQAMIDNYDENEKIDGAINYILFKARKEILKAITCAKCGVFYK